MTTSSQPKCVILVITLKWGPLINVHHISKAARGMHWGPVAKNRYLKRFIDLFLKKYPTLVKDFAFLPALYTIVVIQ